MSDEKIICIERKLIPENWLLREVSSKIDINDFKKFIQNTKVHLIDRNIVEDNEHYKQIIPYVLISKNDELLVYQRQGTEKRLHNLRSAGIGGHINEADYIEGANLVTIYRNLARELKEEINLEFDSNCCKFLGIINEENSKIGRVHLGVVFLYKLLDDVTYSTSEEIEEFAWIKIDSIKNACDFECWTRLAVDLLCHHL